MSRARAAEAAIEELERRLKIACMWLVAKIRENISRSQPVAGKGLSKRGLKPSTYGEFPKRVGGRLMRSITWNLEDELAARVGSTIQYGAILEKSEFLDRGYILRTIRENERTIQRILQTGSP